LRQLHEFLLQSICISFSDESEASASYIQISPSGSSNKFSFLTLVGPIAARHLSDANLGRADLRHVDLTGANLTDADLSEARVERDKPRKQPFQTKKQYARMCQQASWVDFSVAILRNTTMPDGTVRNG
tara:strand:+ start:729 stop:1115 length:387 start_codon:yes stop_codon:yes gene_type:complete